MAWDWCRFRRTPTPRNAGPALASEDLEQPRGSRHPLVAPSVLSPGDCHVGDICIALPISTLVASPPTRRIAGPNWLIGLLAAAIFLSYIDRNLIAVAAPLMKNELGLSATQFGLAVSAFFWIYAPSQLVGGWLTDRLPPRRIFGQGLGLWAVATVATAAVSGLSTLIVSRIVMGLGQSFCFPGSSKLLTLHCDPARRGSANGVVMSGLAAGQAVGALLGGLVIAAYGWRVAFVLFGLTTLMWLVAWRTLHLPAPIDGPAPAPAAPATVPLRAILGKRALWGSAAGHFANNYAFYFMIAWLPLYLVEQRGFSLALMATVTGAGYGVQVASALAGGWLSDRLALVHPHGEGGARKAVMVAANAVKAASIAGVAMAADPAIMVAFVLLNGLTTGLTSAQNFAIPQMFAGARACGRWVGVQNFAANCAGILGPIITGLILDATGSYDSAFALAVGMTILSVACWAWWVPRVRAIDWDA